MKLKTRLSLTFLLGALVLLLNVNALGQAGVQRNDFGFSNEAEKVDIYTLTNSRGAEAKITNYGGIVSF
jgi:hypothetical protein